MLLELVVVELLLERIGSLVNKLECLQTVLLANLDRPPQDARVGLVVLICTLVNELLGFDYGVIHSKSNLLVRVERKL